MDADRNFDDLADRFQKKVYGTLKGAIRLRVLKRDLGEYLPQALALAKDRPLRILDAGGGTGPFSIDQAKLGHEIFLCDLSQAMLSLAREKFDAAGVSRHLTLCHGPIQSLTPEDLGCFDLILCHAVLEWVANPKELLSHLMNLLKPGGIMSLTFYNLNGMIFKNLLRTNYQKILKESYTGHPGSLTPTWPRTPEQVLGWLDELPFQCLCHSGIRVFHDYILSPEHQDREPQTLLELELQFSRKPPFRDMGRYQHILGMKTPAP